MTQAAVSSGTALKRTSWAIVALTIAAIWLACSDKPNDAGGKKHEPDYPQMEIDLYPAWSPDGSKIIYYRTKAIGYNYADTQWAWGVFLHDLNTGSDSLLWPEFEAVHLTWSPDGRRVAFSHNATIFVREIGSDSLIRISPSGRNFRCDWSPLGDAIIYEQTAPINQIWIDGADRAEGRAVSPGLSYPSWFPDGMRFGGVGLGGEVYIADTLGSLYLKLTDTRIPKRDVEVSPTGENIVFVGDRLPLETWYVNTVSLEVMKLGEKGGLYPSWSPDGEWIVYTAYDSLDGHLWIMKLNGLERRQITF